MDNTLQVLHFMAMNAFLCMDIKFIVKVLPLVKLEPIPLCPHYVAGLMNLAGKSIPLVDLAMILGMKRIKKYSIDIPVLLCSNGTDEIAIIVDSVYGLTSVNESELQMHNELKHSASPFLGSITMDAKLSLLLDMQKIFIYCASNGNVGLDPKLIFDSQKV